MSAHGHSDLRRCRVLYRPPNTEYFGCRHRHRLTAARRRPRKTPTNAAAELATAEQHLIHAFALATLRPAVERIAAARDAMAGMLHAEISKAAQVESIISAAEAALRCPRPKLQKLLRCYTKLRRTLQEDERDLLDNFGIGLQ